MILKPICRSASSSKLAGVARSVVSSFSFAGTNPTQLNTETSQKDQRTPPTFSVAGEPVHTTHQAQSPAASDETSGTYAPPESEGETTSTNSIFSFSNSSGSSNTSISTVPATSEEPEDALLGADVISSRLMDRAFSLLRLESRTTFKELPNHHTPSSSDLTGPITLLPNTNITSQVSLMLHGNSNDNDTGNNVTVIPLLTSRGLIHLDADLGTEHLEHFFSSLRRSSSSGPISQEADELAGLNNEQLSDDIDSPDYDARLLTPSARYRAHCRSKIVQARARVRAEELLRLPRDALPEERRQLRPSVLGGMQHSSPLRYSSWTMADFEEYVKLELEFLEAEERDIPAELERIKSWFRDRKRLARCH